MIKIESKGEYKATYKLLEKIRDKLGMESILEKYGRLGVEALKAATPVDSGLTASSWYYEIQNNENGTISISFHNSNIHNYVNIAIILQYGHGTGTGGWVEGRDYINPAIQPVFDELADKIWKEVKGK